MHGLNLYDYGARNYDPAICQFTSMDPLCERYYHINPYAYCAGNPVKYVDFNGDFPILINGRVSCNLERHNARYWSEDIRNTISQYTGYSQSQFKYVDGDRGLFVPQRINNGQLQGEDDASSIYQRLKESSVNGEITEQLQIFSHSRGSAFAVGYMRGLSSEIKKLAKHDGLSFQYGENNIIQYSVNLAPHQSNEIYYGYGQAGITNINVSHYGDLLSGNDAKGNVINIHSNIGNLLKFDQHGNNTYNKELQIILQCLNRNSYILQNLKTYYMNWDQNHNNYIKSIVE